MYATISRDATERTRSARPGGRGGGGGAVVGASASAGAGAGAGMDEGAGKAAEEAAALITALRAMAATAGDKAGRPSPPSKVGVRGVRPNGVL